MCPSAYSPGLIQGPASPPRADDLSMVPGAPAQKKPRFVQNSLPKFVQNKK